MKHLKNYQCLPCEPGSQKMTDMQIDEMMPHVPGWKVRLKDGVEILEKSFSFKDFKQAINFAVKVGRIAEEQFHHPTLTVDWGKVHVTWVTHKLKGLHINDFAMAARTDVLYHEEE